MVDHISALQRRIWFGNRPPKEETRLDQVLDGIATGLKCVGILLAAVLVTLTLWAVLLSTVIGGGR